ncbi:Rha family transcriptional regulator [Clostridium botulinum]|uniref:Rha family transcriptional regulator n=1 Tax=Clostridium botulinum TaxID=1491 RepID=UPI001E5DB1E2
MAKKKNKKDNNGLVITFNNERKSVLSGESWVYTDSLNLAEVLQTEHKEVLKRIRKVLKDYKIEDSNNYKISYYRNSQNKCQPLYKMSQQFTKIVLCTFRKNRYVKNQLSKFQIDTFTTRKENDFIDILEIQFKVFDIPLGQTQYSVLNYNIDYYIPKLNIAIEYDENDHKNYTYEQQQGRQIEIEEELGCKFIRVSDKESHIKNSAYVIKEILKIYHTSHHI